MINENLGAITLLRYILMTTTYGSFWQSYMNYISSETVTVIEPSHGKIRQFISIKRYI